MNPCMKMSPGSFSSQSNTLHCFNSGLITILQKYSDLEVSLNDVEKVIGSCSLLFTLWKHTYLLLPSIVDKFTYIPSVLFTEFA